VNEQEYQEHIRLMGALRDAHVALDDAGVPRERQVGAIPVGIPLPERIAMLAARRDELLANNEKAYLDARLEIATLRGLLGGRS
jgi:hypothetical protein